MPEKILNALLMGAIALCLSCKEDKNPSMDRLGGPTDASESATPGSERGRNTAATKTPEGLLNDLQSLLGKQASDTSGRTGADRNPESVENNPFEGSFIEENLTGFSFFATLKNNELYNKLGVASPEKAKELLADHYGIRPEEVALLASIEAKPDFLNERQARQFMDPANGTAYPGTRPDTLSENLKEILKKRHSGLQLKAEQFFRGARQAREAFYERNPGWHHNDSTLGMTYRDSRNTFIYLPLGCRSFADEVVSYDPGEEGLYPEGALGEPDTRQSNFVKPRPTICNIGVLGSLTVQFLDNALTDVNGPDLYIFETGKIEPTKLALSKDGVNWTEIGKIEGGTAMVDIAPYVRAGETFTYVRLTDLNTWSMVPGADVDAIAAIGGAVRLQLDSSVLFEFGRHELKPEAASTLAAIIPRIEELGGGTLIIEGHTDNVGNGPSNRVLSERRAESVRKHLVSHLGGLSKNFEWKSYGHGDSQPVAPNDTDENRQKNRRVEILVLPH